MDKLQQLAESEGYNDTQDLLEAFITDSVVPGICNNPDCNYTTNVEPDQDKGWCEECDQGSVVSCMVLGEII